MYFCLECCFRLCYCFTENERAGPVVDFIESSCLKSADGHARLVRDVFERGKFTYTTEKVCVVFLYPIVSHQVRFLWRDSIDLNKK